MPATTSTADARTGDATALGAIVTISRTLPLRPRMCRNGTTPATSRESLMAMARSVGIFRATPR
jgi:hypothetical protein